MPSDQGSIAQIEHVTSQRSFAERVFLEVQLDLDSRAAHSWQGWFASWEPLREGDELNITLDDGRRGRAVVERVRVELDLVDPIITFTGTTPLA